MVNYYVIGLYHLIIELYIGYTRPIGRCYLAYIYIYIYIYILSHGIVLVSAVEYNLTV